MKSEAKQAKYTERGRGHEIMGQARAVNQIANSGLDSVGCEMGPSSGETGVEDWGRGDMKFLIHEICLQNVKGGSIKPNSEISLFKTKHCIFLSNYI